MFKPTVTKEWLLATMDLEGDGFINAGGIRDKYPDEEPGFFATCPAPPQVPLGEVDLSMLPASTAWATVPGQ